MNFLPKIVYLQTITECNGHCRYCPFDDVYLGGALPYKIMSFDCFDTILKWLRDNQYEGRLGFLLHYEPTLDDRLPTWIDYAQELLPNTSIEIATNGLITDLLLMEKVNVVDCISTDSLIQCTSRAGNVKACPEIADRKLLSCLPCVVPQETMCIAASGDVLLCCQDWRHEAVVGSYKDLTAARITQLKYAEKAMKLELEICHDCISGKTAEEVGDRLGKRSFNENFSS